MFSNKLTYISWRYTCTWTGKSIHCASPANSICLKCLLWGVNEKGQTAQQVLDGQKA